MMNIKTVRAALQSESPQGEIQRKGFTWVENGTRWRGMGYRDVIGLLGLDDAAIDTNTIVWAHNNWLRRSLSEPGLPKVYKDGPDDKPQLQVGHPLFGLLQRPQKGLPNAPGYSGIQLLSAVARDRQNDGNAYIHKVRKGSPTGPVGWLEWIPVGACMPVAFNGRPNELSHYLVFNNGRSEEVPPGDIIHFRDGIDPGNPLLGCSGLKAAMRLVMADNEIGLYWQALMKMPVPSWLVSAGDSESQLDADFADDLEEQFRSKSSGSRRGGIVAVSGHVKAERMSLSPEELALDKMNKIPVERISAVLGVAALVVGLGAGMGHAKFSNWKEAREQATEEVLVPTWIANADDLTTQLLDEYDSTPGLYLAYDLTKVKALQEERNAAADRVEGLFLSNLITRIDGRSELGYLVDEARDNVFYSDIAGAAIPPNEALAAAKMRQARRDAKNNRTTWELLQAMVDEEA